MPRVVETTLKIEGLQTLLRSFEALKIAAQNRITRSAMSKGVRPVVQAAKAALRGQKAVESGLLVKSMGFRVVTYPRLGKILAVAGPARKKGAVVKVGVGKYKSMYRLPTKYAHLVEGGTKAHTIRAKKKGYLHWKDKAGWLKARKVTVAARPKPFMLPAWRASESSIRRIVVEAFREGIAREAAKAAAKGRR